MGAGAAMNRYRSESSVETPWELIDAVEKRFGKIKFDLAASRANCKARSTKKFFSERDDAFKQDWRKLKGNLWLNPPFGDIHPWAAECAEAGKSSGTHVLFLIPASVGSNWWAEHVDKKADVHFLSPRVTFVGHTASYPKDLALCRYHRGARGLYECWRWKD